MAMNDDELEGQEWEEGKTRPRCKGLKQNGDSCSKTELPDLGYCFAHAPEELIPQAEQLTGRKRCEKHATSLGPEGEPTTHTGQRCGRAAIPGGKVCTSHGGKLPAVRRSAFENILTGKAEQELAEIMAYEERSSSLLTLGGRQFNPVTNPFEELMRLAGEVAAFKDKIGARVDAMKVEEFRYEHSRAGEQIRAEVLIYVKAMEQCSQILTRITKLGIDERMTRINERLAQVIEQAFARTLADPKFDLPPRLQKEMKEQVVRRLRVA